MKKKEHNQIQIAEGGEILYKGLVDALPLKDEQIIHGSIVFYDDPEPCMIHRSAVMARYYTQIDEWIKQEVSDLSRPILLSDFPDELRLLLDFSSNRCP